MRRALVLFAAMTAAATTGAGLVARGAMRRAELVAPPASQIVYDRNGAFLTQIGSATRAASGERRVDYGYWPLAHIPDRVAQATLALEDRRFFSHPGVDPRAVLR